MEGDDDKLGIMINKFWSEFDEFQSKEGVFEHRGYIFKNHEDLINSRAYLWHKKESLVYTKFFGKFACRVCSKILGIGSAERSWGDVKQLKDNKRSHLSGESIKKQATIYGASCMELARFERQEKLKDVSSKPIKFWLDDDFNLSRNKQAHVTIEAKPRRIFKAYIEEWEIKATKKEDVVNKAKLLTKYGGLSWMDPDHDNVILYSDPTTLKWTGRYSVIARDPEYNENDPNKEDHEEPWEICEMLNNEIAHYYRLNTDKGVVVVEPNNNNSDDECDSSDTDDDAIVTKKISKKKK